ncbi:MAG: CoA transferase [Chloroflexota bacterium]
MTPSNETCEAMLTPYRVLDLTDEKGFYCGQLLGSLGADVIKIERPDGDYSRSIAPYYHDQPTLELSLHWLAYNSNKRGVTLNLESQDGKALFQRLVKKADVIVESSPLGYMDHLGLGCTDLERINPALVFTSITPFGQKGPYSDFKGPDLVCWAMGGLLAQTVDPDRPPVRISYINFAYQIASMDAAWSTAMALYWRATSGKGQHIDISIQESIVKTTFMEHEVWEVTGRQRERGSSFYKVPNSSVVLHTVWPVKDGYLYLMLRGGDLGARENPRIVQWMDEEGLADDFIKNVNWAELDWRNCTQAEVDRIHGYFARFFQSKTKAEITQGALERDIILQPICSPKDIVEHPQLEARGYWQEVEYPSPISQMTHPGRFFYPSASACRIWRRAPLVGEHNQEIYQGELGITTEEMVSLEEAGVI